MSINVNLVVVKYVCCEGCVRPDLRSSGFNSIFKGSLDPRTRGTLPQTAFCGAVIAIQTPNRELIQEVIGRQNDHLVRPSQAAAARELDADPRGLRRRSRRHGRSVFVEHYGTFLVNFARKWYLPVGAILLEKMSRLKREQIVGTSEYEHHPL